MKKPSYRQALRMAKQVKLRLASGAEPVSSKVSRREKPLAVAQATPNDLRSKLQFDKWLDDIILGK